MHVCSRCWPPGAVAHLPFLVLSHLMSCMWVPKAGPVSLADLVTGALAVRRVKPGAPGTLLHPGWDGV